MIRNFYTAAKRIRESVSTLLNNFEHSMVGSYGEAAVHDEMVIVRNNLNVIAELLLLMAYDRGEVEWVASQETSGD